MDGQPSLPDVSTERIIALRDRHTTLPSLRTQELRDTYAVQVRKRVAQILLPDQDVTDDIILAAIKDPPKSGGYGRKGSGRPGAAQGRYKPK